MEQQHLGQQMATDEKGDYPVERLQGCDGAGKQKEGKGMRYRRMVMWHEVVMMWLLWLFDVVMSSYYCEPGNRDCENSLREVVC